MNYYIIPIRQNPITLGWEPDTLIVDYEAKSYNIPNNCKIKTESVCSNAIVISKEQYEVI